MKTVEWSAPANIAIVKYWGKTGIQIPANPSLSMTLSTARTNTKVSAAPSKSMGFSYTYAGSPKPEFDQKINTFLTRVADQLPFLSGHHLIIDSQNNFPHSSGISSSASFFASLALALCDLQESIGPGQPTGYAFFEKASRLARLGSGSACRSVYGGWVIWGGSSDPASSDEYAIPVTQSVHPVFQSYRDAVIITSSASKPLSSTAGHSLMNNNPYAFIRYQQARQNLQSLLNILQSGDQEAFIRLTEHEALSLHGLIMISDGGFLLVNPSTIEAINRIRAYRKNSGSKCCFTLDAGPNLHLLYPENEQKQIIEFITQSLLPLTENGHWLDDQIGQGPQKEV